MPSPPTRPFATSAGLPSWSPFERVSECKGTIENFLEHDSTPKIRHTETLKAKTLSDHGRRREYRPGDGHLPQPALLRAELTLFNLPTPRGHGGRTKAGEEAAPAVPVVALAGSIRRSSTRRNSTGSS